MKCYDSRLSCPFLVNKKLLDTNSAIWCLKSKLFFRLQPARKPVCLTERNEFSNNTNVLEKYKMVEHVYSRLSGHDRCSMCTCLVQNNYNHGTLNFRKYPLSSLTSLEAILFVFQWARLLGPLTLPYENISSLTGAALSAVAALWESVMPQSRTMQFLPAEL